LKGKENFSKGDETFLKRKLKYFHEDESFLMEMKLFSNVMKQFKQVEIISLR